MSKCISPDVGFGGSCLHARPKAGMGLASKLSSSMSTLAIRAAQGNSRKNDEFLSSAARTGQTRLATRLTTVPRRVDLYFAGTRFSAMHLAMRLPAYSVPLLSLSTQDTHQSEKLFMPLKACKCCRQLVPSSNLGCHFLLHWILLRQHSILIVWGPCYQ